MEEVVHLIKSIFLDNITRRNVVKLHGRAVFNNLVVEKQFLSWDPINRIKGNFHLQLYQEKLLSFCVPANTVDLFLSDMNGNLLLTYS